MNGNFEVQRAAFRLALMQRYGIDAPTYDAQTQAIASLAKPFGVRKGGLIQKVGVPACTLHWITQGVARIGFTSEDGQDVTTRFAMEGDLATTHDLLTGENGIPAVHYVLAETAVEGFAFDWSAVKKVHATNKGTEAYHAKVLEYRVRQVALHRYAQTTASARERLRIFRTEYPGLESRISQRVIASYLGITPQYLSQLLRRDD